MIDLCKALDVPRKTFYRWREKAPAPGRRRSPRRLSEEEKAKVLNLLTCDEFIDMTVPEVYYTLLDRGEYYCSISKMYDILLENKAVKDRRNQRKHPEYKKPVLKATASNEIWSWDITKLPGPFKGIYYNLYSIIDIYDRFSVGWLISEKENSDLAKELIEQTCKKLNIEKNQLTIHSDRGSPMIAKNVVDLLMDLGVIKSVSRPKVSNDNPYSESQFKTIKYHRTFPERFGSIQHAREFMAEFFEWYNYEHYHSGIEMLTPATLREGKVQDVIENRNKVWEIAYGKNPERFVRGVPKHKLPKPEVWINNPNIKNLKVGA